VVHTITGAQAVRAALDTSVEPVLDAAAGVAWLRAHVARFSAGEDHRRRRGLAVAELSRVDPGELARRAAQRGGHPVEVLADALALPVRLEDVDLVAACYQPHTPLVPGTNEAVSRLIEACGGTPDEATAARIGLLVQAYAATGALVRAAVERGGDGEDSVRAVLRDDPPVRFTRRGGALVDLASAGLPFGAGPHACPGQEHAVALAIALSRREKCR
jgi:hypothetical protein